MCSPNGKAVVLQANSQSSLIDYIGELTKSISRVDLQFELTAIRIRKNSNNRVQSEAVGQGQDNVDVADVPMMDDDIPKYYIDVSRMLYKCLSHICPKVETLRRRSEHLAFCEALRSITDKYSSSFSMFLFGSQAEGSTTPGLESDTDVALICNELIVTKETPKWDPQRIHCRLLTGGVPPGYVQLEWYEHDRSFMMAMTSTERDVSLISHWQVEQMFFRPQRNVKLVRQLHLLLPSQDCILDICFALQTKFREIELPHCLHRQRKNHKLLRVLESQEVLDDCVNLGCVCSPLSFEWKLCFYTTERRLVAAFNPVQMECYILLKVLVKSFVRPHMGNVLSSYHLKTLMFHMIDSTEEAIWTPNNILWCTEMCLKELKMYVVAGCLPDHFIPENNLFQDSVYGRVRYRLIVLLNQLFAEKGRFLLRIKCDRIGDLLALSSVGKDISGNDLVLNSSSFELTLVRTCLLHIQTFLTQTCYEVPFKLLKLLKHDNDHGSNSLKQAASVLIGEVVRRLGIPQYIALLLPKLSPETRMKITNISLLIGAHSGDIVSSLKLATVKYISKETMTAIQSLELVRDKLAFTFSKESVFMYDVTWKMVELLSKRVSIGDIIMKFIADPVVYMVDDIEYTPEALVLEMMHRYFVLYGPGVQFRYPLAIVDTKVYVLFLLHQCYSQLRMNEYRLQVLIDLRRTIEQDITLQYRDTAFNLLAYCLRKEGNTLSSYQYLRHSLFLYRPSSRLNNAAIWQLAFLFNRH